MHLLLLGCQAVKELCTADQRREILDMTVEDEIRCDLLELAVVEHARMSVSWNRSASHVYMDISCFIMIKYPRIFIYEENENTT